MILYTHIYKILYISLITSLLKSRHNVGYHQEISINNYSQYDQLLFLQISIVIRVINQDLIWLTFHHPRNKFLQKKRIPLTHLESLKTEQKSETCGAGGQFSIKSLHFVPMPVAAATCHHHKMGLTSCLDDRGNQRESHALLWLLCFCISLISPSGGTCRFPRCALNSLDSHFQNNHCLMPLKGFF